MELIKSRVRKIGFCFLISYFSLFGFASAASATKGFDGIWVIKSHSLAHISAWTYSEADVYIGSKLIINGDELKFFSPKKKYVCSLGNQKVKILKGNLKTDSLTDPVRKGWIKPEKLGLSKDQNIVNIYLNSLDMPFGGLVLLEKDKKIFILWDGAAFLLEKVTK